MTKLAKGSPLEPEQNVHALGALAAWGLTPVGQEFWF